MIRTFFICLLLIYYWYFYSYKSKDIKEPTTGSISKPEPLKFTFESDQPNHFRFVINGKCTWEHTLPMDTFTFHQDKIVAIDPCHGQKGLVPARGKFLYDYLNKNPDIKNISKVQKNSQFTIQHGDVFYFKCLDGHVQSLEMCPSGTTLVNGICRPITHCTDKPDGTLLPHPSFIGKYISCLDGKAQIKSCEEQYFFYYNRCESMITLNHFCKMHPNESLNINETTKLRCRNGKSEFVKCLPGRRFFDNSNVCEPANCVGLPDGTKLPLPEQNLKPFRFVPGYMTCYQDKIQETVECPKTWDEILSKGDNLLFLPMVFDGTKCSVPTFCENVFSDDPDTIVPLHEFTKHVKNWNLSKLYDHSEGFVCENRIRKRKSIPSDMRISKRFKVEPACKPPMPNHLPIYGNPHKYYDCNQQLEISCPNSQFFNGTICTYEPQNAFTFNKLPFFQFDSLNEESWIKAFDYSKIPKPVCNQNFTYNEMYNICSHPDCVKYEFISQIPLLAILLPFEKRAKCKYYDNERTLYKEPVDFQYQFWDQRVVDKRQDDENCQPGQKIKSGNLIWDSTVFATCNMDQPFVFCPSTHTEKIIPINDKYFACEPPKEKSFILNNVDWTPFEGNEIKRILPIDPQDNSTTFRMNKKSSNTILPQTGVELAENVRLNFRMNKPIRLEPRYRVTYPPNVAFEYSDEVLEHSNTPNHGFLMRIKDFTTKSLNFAKHIFF